MAIRVRRASPQDAVNMSDLARSIYRDELEHQFTREGSRIFLSFTSPGNISALMKGPLFGYVAEIGGETEGVILMKRTGTISLFFISRRFRHRGIGRELLREAITSLLVENPGVSCLRVNSIPSAVPIYEKLGFEITGREEVLEGIRFVPMEMKRSEIEVNFLR